MTPSEIEAVRRLAREFSQKELAPHVADFDEREEFPMDAYRTLVRTGLHAVGFPESLGGGGSVRALCTVAEELARVDPGFVLSVLASSQLFGFNLTRLGTAEQQKTYAEGLVHQGKIGCWALTEPEVGSDAVGIRTRAEKQGDHYVLNGSKTFITNAPIADYFIVLAREYGNQIEGGTAFILERGHPGMELSRPLKKMGHRTSPTGQIFLHQCRVSASQVLGSPGKAFFDMKHSLDIERLVFSGIVLGVTKECLDRAARYSLGRKQFGRPIADFQLVQEKIAEMASWTEILSAYSDHIFQRFEAGESIHFEVAVLKSLGADACVKTADAAVQVLGGNGYMREYFVEKLLRDARLYPIGGGTTEINKLIIAREALKRYQ
jgi:alkylation response protein AidB-like acyl-CoA dehydrogenase